MNFVAIISACCIVSVTASDGIKSSHGSFNDDYIDWSEQKLLNYTFSRDLKWVDVTGLSNTQKDIYAPVGSCPNFTTDYLRNAGLNQRSTSPWEYFINFDKNRLPKTILDTRCLCRGCINKDGYEATEHTVSVGIPRQITVTRNNVKWNERIRVGCTCIFP